MNIKYIVIILILLCVLGLCGFCSYSMYIGSKTVSELEEVDDSENGEDPVEDSAEDSSETTESVPEEVITVELTSFVEEFDANQLAAEGKYEGKLIQTSGYINNISEDILGTPFITIHPSNEEFYFGTYLQCMFDSEEQLTSLINGEMVTVKGRVTTQSLGIIGAEDCEVL